MKDLLSAVGQGGGAAAAPAAGGAAAGGAAPAEEAKEEKVEGEFAFLGIEYGHNRRIANNPLQRRRSRMRTWASVSSTKVASTWAGRGFDSSGSLCTSKTCMDMRRHLAYTTTGMEALISGVLVHRRSLRNLKMRF